MLLCDTGTGPLPVGVHRGGVAGHCGPIQCPAHFPVPQDALSLCQCGKCEPDKQGRFSLPAELRQYAGLGQDVTFIGQGGHAEIWDSAAYEALEQETLTPENLAAAMEELGF